MDYTIHYSCISHIGKCRSNNQDNYICEGHYLKVVDSYRSFSHSGCVSSSQSSLFGVFDGLGGEECGEVAAFIAAKEASTCSIGEDAITDLSNYCVKANEEICTYAKNSSILSMGTTVAAVAFGPKVITVCNIGDSKVFRLSAGKLQQISKDHICLAPYGTKPPLSQNLGIPPDEMVIEPYFAQGYYDLGDVYLLCSDGLTDMVSIGDITKTLLRNAFDEAAEKLLNAALENGGKDNITIILCKIEREKHSLFNRLFMPINKRKGDAHDGK